MAIKQPTTGKVHPMKPKTAAEAHELLATLEARRVALNATIDTSAERRKGHVVAAEFGDAPAKEALRQIVAEDLEAREALRNLDIVVAEVTGLYTDLAASEVAVRDRLAAAQISKVIDALLAIDDEIDDALDLARELLAKRREIARAPILKRAKTKFTGVLAIRDDGELGASILAYFDRELSHLHNGHSSYATITRVADWDAKYFLRQSPGQIRRGPRELSAFERTMRARA